MTVRRDVPSCWPFSLFNFVGSATDPTALAESFKGLGGVHEVLRSISRPAVAPGSGSKRPCMQKLKGHDENPRLSRPSPLPYNFFRLGHIYQRWLEIRINEGSRSCRQASTLAPSVVIVQISGEFYNCLISLGISTSELFCRLALSIHPRVNVDGLCL